MGLAEKKTLALIGAKGMLAAMVSEAAGDGWDIVPFDLPEFDMTDSDRVDDLLGRLRPQVIVNCAAYTNVDGCETEEALAMRVNCDGVGNLARAAVAVGATLVHISTDYVFDGRKDKPYVEEDSTGPESAYGRSKLAGERAILESGLERFFIIRTSWLYGPGGKNFVETILRLAAERRELGIVADQVGTPTYTADLARAIFALLEAADAQSMPPYGIYHFSDEGLCSWHEFATAIVELGRQKGLPLLVEEIRPITTAEYPLPATRPAYSVFSKAKFKAATGMEVPHWRSSLEQYMILRLQRRFTHVRN